MESIPIRELRNDTGGVIARLGMTTFEITSRGRPVARLSPIEPARPRYMPVRELGRIAAARRATPPDPAAYDQWMADLADLTTEETDDVVDPWERDASRRR